MLADIRMAFRLLWRAPAYVAVIVAKLGLGIGGVTAVFTLADPMIFRPLPFVDSERVVEVRARVLQSASHRLHADDFVTIAESSQTLDAVATLQGPYVGQFRDGADPIMGGGVSRDFLRLTGLQPALGRVFAPEEYERDLAQLPTVAMLTWAFWQRAFGGEADVVGSQLELGGSRPFSMEIVGVLPREFFYPEATNEAPVFIVPGKLDPRYLGRANVFPTILARVRPEYTFTQAEAELDALLAVVERANPTFEQGRKARLIPLQDLLFAGIRTPLLLLFIATGCLLMLAWVNLSHLALARARARAKDLAVRVALGAGRWRVVRLLVTEAGILAVLGSLVGVGVGSVLFSWGMSRTPRFSHIYRLLPTGLDIRAVGFTLALAAIAMVAIGLWPALRSVRGDLRTALAAQPDPRRGWRVGGEALAIVGQTAFAVGLVVTCLLVVRSFVALITDDRGFDPAGVRLVRVQLPTSEPPAATVVHWRRLIDTLNGVPGVEAAAVSNGVPALTLPEGVIDPQGDRIPDVVVYQVTERFAAAMGMHLEEGRLFDDDEAFGGAPVAVVDRTAAEMMWPGEHALGKGLRLGSGRDLTVVGVLRRARTNFYADSTPMGTIFASIEAASPNVASRLRPILRLDPRRPATDAAMMMAAEEALPGLTWGGTVGMSSWERLLGQPRFLASALGVLAGLTVLLAGFGVLGVVSHLVSRRTREIGIRIALGADRLRVRLLVIRQAILPATVGVGAGLILAFWWSASVRAAIVGIGPHDPWSFAAAGIATLVTVVIASVRPAARASRIDPAVTLRAE